MKMMSRQAGSVVVDELKLNQEELNLQSSLKKTLDKKKDMK